MGNCCISMLLRSDLSILSLRLLRSGSVEVSTQTDQVFDSQDSTNKTENINPWSLRCHKKTLTKLRKANQGPVTHCSIL